MVDTRSSGDYREKYRRALDEQEQLEKRFTAQISLLRKTLLQVTTVSQGIDNDLDKAFDALRVKFKNGSGSEIVQQLEKVQLEAESFERTRLSRSEKSAEYVKRFIDQLLELQIPGDLRRGLKGFNGGLAKRLVFFKNYTDILDELAKLQMLALQSASDSQASFWTRVKGGNTLRRADDADSTVESDVDSKPERTEALEPVELDSGFDDFETEDMELAPSTADLQSETSTALGAFDPGTEENYQEVAIRIAGTLENLVNRIEPNDVVKHKIDIVKMRIKRGMDWFVLAVTLEDIRDILMLRYLQADADFSEYLQNVNDQLLSISEALGIVADHETKMKSSANEFTSSVSEQLGLMKSSLDNANEIGELKREVSGHLVTIAESLAHFQAVQRETAPLSTQLEDLVRKVQTIEAESQKTKELLEEERHRATHDSLTGLPNREAYSERAFAELQRFQRYGHPLTMAVCDIDKFKSINDNFGHQAGDKVLKIVAKLLSTRIRNVDFVARYGGEEFVLVMPETDAEQAKAVLDKIRLLMAKTPFRFKEKPVSITMSFGISEFVEGDNVEDVFGRADLALYDAKNNGRNRCEIRGPESPSA